MKSLMVVAVMMACTLATVCYTDASDADISTDAPNMKFFVYVNNSWESYTGQGYDAAQALADTNISFTWATDVVNGTTVSGEKYTYSYSNYGYSYYSINPIYGKVATVNNSSDFTVYYFDGTNWVSNSVIGLQSVGFYRPFDDYTLQTANIAFVPSNVSPNTLPTTGLEALEAVTEINAYKVTFIVNNNTYYGYGSDCATAFKDAMIRNNINYTIDLSMVITIDNVQYLNLNYYGQVTRIANQIQADDVEAEYDPFTDTTHVVGDYDYWALSLGDLTSSSYMLGFYSPLSYAPLPEDDFYLTFTHDHFEWDEDGDTTWKYDNN